MSGGRRPEVDALLQMQNTLRDMFDESWPKTPEATKLRTVCVGMCQAEGHDPLVMCMGIPGSKFVPNVLTANNTVGFCFPIMPQWATYARHASDAITIVGSIE